MSDIKTRTYQKDSRTFIEKRLGDLVLTRELTAEDLYVLRGGSAAQAGKKWAEIDEWHRWAERQILNAKLTDL